VTELAFYEDKSMEKLNEPSDAVLSNAPNPWSKKYWHLTNHARIMLRDRGADRLARAAGHKDAPSASLARASRSDCAAADRIQPASPYVVSF